MADEGDNKEFAVSGVQEVKVHFTGDNTSSNDTETDKYFDFSFIVIKFNVRSDESIKITKLNNRTLTDPITVTKDKGHTEKHFGPMLDSITLKTTVAGVTNIKVRAF